MKSIMQKILNVANLSIHHVHSYFTYGGLCYIDYSYCRRKEADDAGANNAVTRFLSLPWMLNMFFLYSVNTHIQSITQCSEPDHTHAGLHGHFSVNVGHLLIEGRGVCVCELTTLLKSTSIEVFDAPQRQVFPYLQQVSLLLSCLSTGSSPEPLRQGHGHPCGSWPLPPNPQRRLILPFYGGG